MFSEIPVKIIVKVLIISSFNTQKTLMIVKGGWCLFIEIVFNPTDTIVNGIEIGDDFSDNYDKSKAE